MPKTLTFKYLNHNGKISVRTVDVEELEFDFKPGYGYQPGWAISGFCHDKQARRTFFLSRILFEDHQLPPANHNGGNFVHTLMRF
jgi:predicted DNA-binding transcriptional regulator YafY